MSRIPIGQYYPADSIIHRLDARVKIFGTFFYIVMLFFVGRLTGFFIAGVFILSCVFLAKVPLLMVLRGLRAIIFVLIFAGGINIFLTPGENVVFQAWIIRVTSEGLWLALNMVLRLVLLVMGSAIMTLTTSPIRLTDGIESLLSPLRRFRVPTSDIAMMMTIALRFIPTLAEEAEKIIRAQRARGADFDTGGLIARAKSLLPILIPLFVLAFKRADELATAMESRAFVPGAPRSKMHPMKMTGRDFVGLVVVFVMGGLVVWLG